MQDIRHIPEIVDGEERIHFVCKVCGVNLPSDVCIASGGADVYEVSGCYVPDSEKSVACNSSQAEKIRELTNSNYITIDALETPKDGSEKFKKHTWTDFEKNVHRQALQNFWAMREMTKPAKRT